MPRTWRLEALLLALVVLVGASLRIGPLVTNPEAQRGGYGQFGDTQLYHRIAVNLLRGQGFSATTDGSAFGGPARTPVEYAPAVTRPPAYPTFLAGVYRLVGAPGDSSPEVWRTRWHAARLAQGVLDVGTCLLVYLLVTLIAPGLRWAPLAAAAGYALSPYNAFYSRELLAESVGTFLVAAATLLSVRALGRSHWRGWVAAGVAWGLAALCLAQLILFPPFLGLWLVLRGRAGWRAGMTQAVALGAGMLIAVGPWTVRNFRAFDRVIPIAVGATGYQMFLGTFETRANWTGWEVLPEEQFPDPRERARIDSLVREMYTIMDAGSPEMAGPNGELRRLALERLRADPGRALAAWFESVPRLWFQNYIPMYRDREASGGLLLGVLLAAVAAVIVVAGEERRRRQLPLLLAAYLTLLFLPLHVEARYSVTAIPGLVALAAIGVVGALRGVLSGPLLKRPGRPSAGAPA